MVKPIYGKDYPKVSTLEFKTTIALVNTNPAIGFPEPLPPNVIPVGGLQIVDPKPLSEVSYLQRSITYFIIHYILSAGYRTIHQ